MNKLCKLINKIKKEYFSFYYDKEEDSRLNYLISVDNDFYIILTEVAKIKGLNTFFPVITLFRTFKEKEDQEEIFNLSFKLAKLKAFI